MPHPASKRVLLIFALCLVGISASAQKVKLVNLKVRPANVEDAQAIHGVRLKAYQTHGPVVGGIYEKSLDVGALEKLIQGKNYLVMVALNGDTVVGSASNYLNLMPADGNHSPFTKNFAKESGHAYFEKLAVLPEYHGNGVGRAVTTGAIDALLTTGYHSIWAHTSDGWASEKLLKNLGFKQLGAVNPPHRLWPLPWITLKLDAKDWRRGGI